MSVPSQSNSVWPSTTNTRTASPPWVVVSATGTLTRAPLVFSWVTSDLAGLLVAEILIATLGVQGAAKRFHDLVGSLRVDMGTGTPEIAVEREVLLGENSGLLVVSFRQQPELLKGNEDIGPRSCDGVTQLPTQRICHDLARHFHDRRHSR
jgi:hypothetical protein